ncbi:MAG: hypothetical protein CSB44_07935 [Gammaproteobacteria bacterium]|nr:MAG: hypothetical protein CSB44_07935 [Gammaproteobacteria bacterium]
MLRDNIGAIRSICRGIRVFPVAHGDDDRTGCSEVVAHVADGIAPPIEHGRFQVVAEQHARDVVVVLADRAVLLLSDGRVCGSESTFGNGGEP